MEQQKRLSKYFRRPSGRIKTCMLYAGLCCVSLACCFLFTWKGGVFGAKMDWLSQHSVIPDYFRQQFYETGELFPEFAASLGGGQNIYYFSYYGLYSPVVLFSYLLPFVKMSDYLMGASAAALAAAVCLMYRWLENREMSPEVRLSVSLMFLLAGPMIYQSCHQVMFVNYMPWLCLAFLGVDRYFEERRSGLLTCSVFLMIMTSFYFSIGGMLALVLYGISRWAEKQEKVQAQKEMQVVLLFFKDGFRFLLPFLTAVLMAGVLLVPTAYTIFGSSGRAQKTVDLKSLLLPEVSILKLLYNSYGIGLTSLALTALIAGFAYRKWSERILIWGCAAVLVIPVFCWALNGGLYVRDKALIPFLPLFCYLIALYLKKNQNRELPAAVNVIAGILTVGVLLYGHYVGKELAGNQTKWYLILADGVLLLVCILLWEKWRKLWILVVPSIVCLCLFGVSANSLFGGLADRETYARATDSEAGETVRGILREDSGENGMYRIEQTGTASDKAANINRVWSTRQWITSLYSSSGNEYYTDFRDRIFQVDQTFRNSLMENVSDNPLFQRFMGVRYRIRRTEEGADGDTDRTTDGAASYEVEETELAAPVIYGTDRVISEEAYQTLGFPYNQTALVNYAVVRNAADNDAAAGNCGDAAERSAADGSEDADDGALAYNGAECADDIAEALASTAEETPVSLPEISEKTLTLKETGQDNWKVKAGEDTAVTLTLPETGQSKRRLLYLQFRVKNHRKSRDVSVWLNGTRNKLSEKGHLYYNGNTTFTWVTELSAGQSEVELVLGKGNYTISQLSCYLGSLSAATADIAAYGSSLYQSVFLADQDQTQENRICGIIVMKQAGYLITSIPYDRGFEILVDGEKAACERVNTAFLGCRLGEGTHTVEIIYHAPGLAAGKCLSAAGVLLWAAMGAWEAAKKKDK